MLKLTNIFSYIYINLVGRAFANGPGDRVRSLVESYQRLKTMVFDVAMLNTQHYKVQIKGKVEQSKEKK